MDQNKDNSNSAHTSKGSLTGDSIKTSPIFRCKVCPYNTLRKPFLDKHMQQKHGFSKIDVDCSPYEYQIEDDMETNIKRKKIIISDSEASSDLWFACEVCEFKTKEEVLLNLHLQKHGHGETDEELYQCNQCNFQTFKPETLQSHAAMHQKSEVFHCSVCDYASTRKSNLNAHLQIHVDHGEAQSFSCHFCNNFKTYYIGELYKHIGKEHKQEGQLFNCRDCGYTTTSRSRMTSHQRTHRKNWENCPKFKCEKCTFMTHNEITIKKHVEKHKEREKTGEEIIVKETIGKVEHTWFCCNLCEFRSKEHRYVLLHKKVHSRTDEINRLGKQAVNGIEIDTCVKQESD